MFVTGVQGTSLRWSRFHRQRDALCIKADLERAFRWTKERAGCRFQAVEERWRARKPAEFSKAAREVPFMRYFIVAYVLLVQITMSGSAEPICHCDGQL